MNDSYLITSTIRASSRESIKEQTSSLINACAVRSLYGKIAMVCILYMRGSRKFCQRGSNFDMFFCLVNEGREDPNTTISGSL